MPSAANPDSQKTIVIPLEGGDSPDASLGAAMGPTGAGLVAFLIGLFVMLVLSQKADPNESAGIRLFGAGFMLFGALFIKVGLSSVLGILAARRRRRNPEPWLRDHAWNRRYGQQNQYVSILPHVTGLLLYTALILPFNTIWTAPWLFFRIVVGVLDLIWLAVAWESVRRILQRLRVGEVRLEWGTFPFYVGQRFDAIFRASRRIAATGPMRVTLRAVAQRWTHRGGNDSASKDSIVLESETLDVPPPPAGESFPISFPIPATAPGTTLAQTEPVFWQVEVTAPTAGPDFSATFLVPIYSMSFEGAREREGASATAAPSAFRMTVRQRSVGGSGRPGDRRGPLIGSVLFGAIGLLLINFAWSFGRDSLAFHRGAAEVDGVVVRNDARYSASSSGSSSSRSYIAIVHYEVDGRSYETEQSVGSGSPTYAEQERVRVIYPVAAPSEGRIKSVMELYFPIILLGGMGLACCAAALIVFVVFVRQQRNGRDRGSGSDGQ